MKANSAVHWYDVLADCDRTGKLIQRLPIVNDEEYAWEVRGSDGNDYLVEETILQIGA